MHGRVIEVIFLTNGNTMTAHRRHAALHVVEERVDVAGFRNCVAIDVALCSISRGKMCAG